MFYSLTDSKQLFLSCSIRRLLILIYILILLKLFLWWLLWFTITVLLLGFIRFIDWIQFSCWLLLSDLILTCAARRWHTSIIRIILCCRISAAVASWWSSNSSPTSSWSINWQLRTEWLNYFIEILDLWIFHFNLLLQESVLGRLGIAIRT